jgi:hypothetical protein
MAQRGLFSSDDDYNDNVVVITNALVHYKHLVSFKKCTVPIFHKMKVQCLVDCSDRTNLLHEADQRVIK